MIRKERCEGKGKQSFARERQRGENKTIKLPNLGNRTLGTHTHTKNGWKKEQILNIKFCNEMMDNISLLKIRGNLKRENKC